MSNNTKHRAHNHTNPDDLSARKLIITIILNFIITIVQIIGGILSQSLSLISDALHNLSDAFAILISYVAFRIGRKEKNLRKTFGYKRAEILAALLNASVLIIISFYLFKEAIIRLQSPVKIDGTLMLIVALVGLFANLVGVLLLRPDSKKNINMKSAYLHLISDTVSSVAVIIGSLIIHFFEFHYIDSIFTILIGLYVLKEGYHILRDTIDILMQSAPKNIDIMAIKKEVDEIAEVDNIHHIHVWQTNDRDIFLEGHVDFCKDYKLSEIDRIRKKIEKILKKKYHLRHITLQAEFGICLDKELIAKS